MANLYTKTGDSGQTGLVGGSRVSKDELRVQCYGTIDEANSMLGMAFSLTENDYIKSTINKIQKKLFTLGAELACDQRGMQQLGKHILQEADVTELESIVDYCTETTGKQTGFVVPGVNTASSALHVARTIVRRAERILVTIRKKEAVRDVVAKYVNRLSDTIYALARLEETLHQQKELRALVTKMVKERLEKKGLKEMSFDLKTAKAMAELAQEKALEMNVPIVFSAVDRGGNLLLLHRMEQAILASLDISMNKAYTAIAFRKPTAQLAQAALPGGELYGIQNTNDNRIIVFGGGYPYVVNGEVVGAIGISGGTVEEDSIIAEYVINKMGGMN